MRRITSALFVDFDNVFLGLRRLGEDVAVGWGTDPGEWLSRLERGEDSDGLFVRRMLVRNCYLNPSAFADYRAPFTRAGFRVIDCPSLTQQGKSAADVNLVLDVLDVLHGPLHYDEFFIMSADADFTPLAIRCREADRRVTIADDVGDTPFSLAATGKRVRDACQAAGFSVGRGTIDFVLKGVLYAGFNFDGRPDVHVIAEHWADNVVGLSRGARMELTEGDEKVIRDWVGGGLA
ncbi:MAG TPA: NYN domain-containing protein [Nocardioidaceae bacterium]|nr:NYN domain-containing protein [Nocardioidaceae bacterium]